MNGKRFVSVTASVAITVAMTAIAWGQVPEPKLPSTEPGKYLGGWLSNCAQPNLAKMTHWDQEHAPERLLKRVSAGELAKRDYVNCRLTGGYSVSQVISSTPQAIEVLAVSRTGGDWTRIMMRIEGGKLAGLGITPAAPPESARPKHVTESLVGQELATTVKRLADEGRFSGIAVVASRDKIIAQQTAGYANRARKTPITSDTQFTLGSMGKMFTSVAVGQLVDQGKLSYDNTVGKFFPNYANKTVRDKVTVGMLLSHTGGLGDFLDKRTPEMMKRGVQRASEFVPLFENDEPEFEPGKSWAYSNAGLALAGAIVEKVSGEPYPEYLRKHIFAFAGMTNSDPNNVPHTDTRLVTPYTQDPKSGEWTEAEHDVGSPAGGAISSVADLLRFADALRSGKLVTASTFATMVAPRGSTPAGEKYGYGLGLTALYGKEVVGHGGGFPGVSTQLDMVLGSPYTIVVLTNQDPPAAQLVDMKIRPLVVELTK